MPSVEIHEGAGAGASGAPETPTQRVVRQANAVSYIETPGGHRIGWRKLRSLEAMDLAEIAGAQSLNPAWMTIATAAYSVVEIDGEPVRRPANRLQLRALITRLDDDGVDALVGEFMRLGAEMQETAEAEAARGKD